MNITKIEKKKRLYLLETDTGNKCYITEDTIVRFMLSKGKVISEADFQDIERYAQLSYGKNLALYFLSFKQRTCKEVATYLNKYKISEEIIPTIIQLLQDEGWLNDQTYTQNFLHQNQLSGDKGPAVLSYKLTQKGIPLSLIEEELTGMEFESVLERLLPKLLRKYQDKLPLRALQDKLLQQLLSKGFPYDLAKNSLVNLDLEAEHEQEQALLEREYDKAYRKLSRKYDGYQLKQGLTQTLLRKGFDYGQIKSFLRDHL